MCPVSVLCALLLTQFAPRQRLPCLIRGPTMTNEISQITTVLGTEEKRREMPPILSTMMRLPQSASTHATESNAGCWPMEISWFVGRITRR